jgi:hypothetical protein
MEQIKISDYDWSVQDKVARPVNPYKPNYDARSFEEKITFEETLFNYNRFEQFASQHTYSTNAPNGVHKGSDFGEVVWQHNYDGEWHNQTEEQMKLSPIGKKYKSFFRQFLPYQPPVAEVETVYNSENLSATAWLKSKGFKDRFISTEFIRKHSYVSDVMEKYATWKEAQLSTIIADKDAEIERLKAENDALSVLVHEIRNVADAGQGKIGLQSISLKIKNFNNQHP